MEPGAPTVRIKKTEGGKKKRAEIRQRKRGRHKGKSHLKKIATVHTGGRGRKRAGR